MKRFPDHPERRPVVVAGASSGIGAATALSLAAAGHPVALGARRVDKLQAVADAVRQAGVEVVAHPLDVTETESVQAFGEACRRDLGDIEVVVASAALVQPGATLDVSSQTFATELDLNIVGVHRLLREFVPDMSHRRRGDVVVVSSDVAGRARPMMGAYTASKWGVEGMVAALQMELEGTGVRVSVVRPGPTMTEMGMDWDGEGVLAAIETWSRFGLARHDHFMPASAIGDAIASIVGAPRGVHLSLVEVDPEAPIGAAPIAPDHAEERS